MAKPILSIVSPTRPGFPESWIQELVKIKGDVEFIVVHPPGLSKHPIEDSRLQQINSPFKGEIIQRLTGLLNARGTYVLTVNCDEYLNPDLVEIVVDYYKRFPDSWVLRLNRKDFDYGDKRMFDNPWETLKNIDQLKVCSKAEGNSNLFTQTNEYMLEIPIAPVDNKFDWLCVFRGRQDHHGPHTENFDKKVWKNQLVQETIQEIASMMNVAGYVKYVPFWCLDRLLGLFLQAKFYEKGKVIGHLLPSPEQIRIEDNPPQYRRTRRFYVFAEIFLLKRFPQYGYIWNLIIHQIREIPVRAVASIMRKKEGFVSQQVSETTVSG